MAARMEIIVVPGKIRHPAQVVLQHGGRETPCLRIRSTQIHGVRPVGNQSAEAQLPHDFHCPGTVLRVFFFCLGASGISGKEREGIGADLPGGIHHGGIAPGSGQMTADIAHMFHPFAVFYHAKGKKANPLSFFPGVWYNDRWRDAICQNPTTRRLRSCTFWTT